MFLPIMGKKNKRSTGLSRDIVDKVIYFYLENFHILPSCF
ncbi:hypothetical protein D3OALGA1CA_4023 [Olavius algarvensis associated proteobacterium Delta 3]|nr:hypothetical protein D3OALGB2SA_3421 [Olavius algarvensis associated proteobacterium Delta 3]CAB5143881.1 hypothetical protein D3OALGA1CA_4023 [Olavius algarvensis associated proteobacterium Delta 3]